MDGFSSFFGFGKKKRSLFHRSQAKSIASLNTDMNIFSANSCVVFITLVNTIGTICRVQNKFENIFGYSREKAIGKNISIILPPAMKKLHEDTLEEYLRNPEAT